MKLNIKIMVCLSISGFYLFSMDRTDFDFIRSDNHERVNSHDLKNELKNQEALKASQAKTISKKNSDSKIPPKNSEQINLSGPESLYERGSDKLDTYNDENKIKDYLKKLPEKNQPASVDQAL